MNKRKTYPGHRKYQSWQLKQLLKTIQCHLTDAIKGEFGAIERLDDCKEMMAEIELRLD